MNEMNELETQLRSWAPRRPSARISEALFGREAVARLRRERELNASHSSAFLLNWLAPAVAAVALMFAFFHLPSNPTHSGRSIASPAIAVILSNQSLGSILFEASNREPANPTSAQRAFDVRSVQPKSFGVATSEVSTGASERLPNWQSQPRMEERDNPATNGARLAPRAAIRVSFEPRMCANRDTALQTPDALLVAAHCPEGTTENSPTFQRWERGEQRTASPEGTADSGAPSFNRLFAADAVSTFDPTLKRWAIVAHPSRMKVSVQSYNSGNTPPDTVLVSPPSSIPPLC